MPDNDNNVTLTDVTGPSTPSDPGYQYVDTSIDEYEEEDEYWEDFMINKAWMLIHIVNI